MLIVEASLSFVISLPNGSFCPCLALSGSFWLGLLVLSGSSRLTLRLYLAHSGSLWLVVWLSLAVSGSLWLSQALFGSLLLSEFAYKALAWLTRPLLGSQRRCNTLISPGDWKYVLI